MKSENEEGEGFDAFSVLVLDSGIGGLSIVSAFRQMLPGLSVTYIADNALFPYGALSENDLERRLRELVTTAFQDQVFDAVVIACNTASTVVLESLRQFLTCPVVGVVPPVKTAGEQSKSRKIAMLSTPGTANRSYIQDLLNRFAADCDALLIGCPNLALLAENKMSGKGVDLGLLRNDISELLDDAAKDVDAVILGCTHFPFLKEELEAELGRDVVWLDPAFPVALRLKSLLQGNVALNKPVHQENNVFLYTGEVSSLSGLQQFLTDTGFKNFRAFNKIVA